MSALVARAVGKSFGGVQALADVSLTLQPGEIHGLVGPNGCGKTTLLNLFSGYYAVDSGSIVLGERDLLALPAEERVSAGLSRTFQTPQVLGKLNALENVMVGAWRHRSVGFVASALGLPKSTAEEKRDRARAGELLAAMGLGQAAQRPADSFEHSQRRFLEIARALMTRPKFLLLDEPAGGLTHVEIERLGQVIEAIAEAGIGVLIVEHHTDFVFSLCHTVTALNLGRLLTSGAPAAVRGNADLIKVYLGQ